MSVTQPPSPAATASLRKGSTGRFGPLTPLGARLRGWLLATLAGLVLAAIVHIVTVLLVPRLSESDAASAYLLLGSNGKTELVTGPNAARGLPELREADPAAAVAACSYDLTGGPMRIVARTGLVPLGLTLHRRGGGVLYAVTDRAAIRGVIEFVLLTEEQRAERLARDVDGESVRELRVVSDTLEGLVVARALAGRPSDRADAEALAESVECGLAE
jgi:uncharacterized membrane protein